MDEFDLLGWSIWLLVPLLCWVSYRMGEQAGRRKGPPAPVPRRAAPESIPSAQETADVIARFRAAAARYALLEFIWDRYEAGRELIAQEQAPGEPGAASPGARKHRKRR